MTSLCKVPAKGLVDLRNNWKDVRIWGCETLRHLRFLPADSQVVESVRLLFSPLCLWKLMKMFTLIHLSSKQIKHICSGPRIMQLWPNCVEAYISLAVCTSQTWARLALSGPIIRLHQIALGLQESKSCLSVGLLSSIVQSDLPRY